MGNASAGRDVIEFERPKPWAVRCCRLRAGPALVRGCNVADHHRVLPLPFLPSRLLTNPAQCGHRILSTKRVGVTKLATDW